MKKIPILVCLLCLLIFSNANATSSVFDKTGLIEFNKAQPIMIIDNMQPCKYEWQLPPTCTE